jgi:hypothetical protein
MTHAEPTAPAAVPLPSDWKSFAVLIATWLACEASEGRYESPMDDKGLFRWLGLPYDAHLAHHMVQEFHIGVTRAMLAARGDI